MPLGSRADTDDILSYFNLGKLWALADYLKNRKLCNALTDEVILNTEEDFAPIAPLSVEVLWKCCPVDSPMRRLIRDICTVYVDLDWLEDPDKAAIPQDLLLYIAAEQFQQGRTLPPNFLLRCKYHVHADGEELCLPYQKEGPEP